MPERPFETTVLVKLHEFGYPERHAAQTIERLGEVLRLFGSHEILDWYWEETDEETGRYRQEDQSNGAGVAGGTVAVRTATGASPVHSNNGPATHPHSSVGEQQPQPHVQPGEHVDGELDLRDFRGRLDRRREHILGWLAQLQHHQPIGGSVEDTDPQPEADQTPVPESPQPDPAPEPEDTDAAEETEESS